MTASSVPQPAIPLTPAALETLRATVEAWMTTDPDPASVAELRLLLEELPASAPELADRFSGTLTFGTAGLRGPLRAGPNGMNHAVVRAAAAGVLRYLERASIPGPVVVGYDARWGSHAFAMETVAVIAGTGRTAFLLPHALPTPVLAYAVRELSAAAGVMVTASHNPPHDNGYKVYLHDGAQIVPPVDTEIETAINSVEALTDVPLGVGFEPLSEAFVNSYVDNVVALADPNTPRDLRIAYTPLHGVGGEIAPRVLTSAGFTDLKVVPEQAQPDPRFPTVAFPNPEEPGALDLLLAFATEIEADLALANDPDADRCAAAVRDHTGTWRALTGDELGILLADHLIRRGARGAFATTIVSSSLLAALCRARHVPYAQTLTGFKWIMRGADDLGVQLSYGYEEALGYSVAPTLVRDKDGISAALLTAELAAGLRAEGRTVLDRLDELAYEFGGYATAQVSLRFDTVNEITAAMTRLRTELPVTLVGRPVERIRDLSIPGSEVASDPPGIAPKVTTNAIIVHAAGVRLVVRPSGTEPKLKGYLEVVIGGPFADSAALANGRREAQELLAAARAEFLAMMNP